MIQALNMGAVGLFAIALVAAAVSDVSRFQIPNYLPIIIAAAFLVAHPDAAWLVRLANHGSAGLALLFAGLVMFRFGLLGGGDVKLIAACGLWTGWPLMPAFLFLTIISGGVISLSILAARLILKRNRFQRPAFLARLIKTNTGVPYGVAISAAGLALVPRLIGAGAS